MAGRTESRHYERLFIVQQGGLIRIFKSSEEYGNYSGGIFWSGGSVEVTTYKDVSSGNILVARKDSPGSQGSNGAVRLAQELAMDHPDWVFLYQYGNNANPTAHFDTTGPEILADVPDITHFVAGLGTSGTLMGVGTYLKEQKPEVKVMAVEPPSGEIVDGLRSLDDGFIPPVFDKWGGLELLDGKRIVRPVESIEFTRRLAAECGIFAGLSSGAAAAGAARVAERIPEGEEAVVVFIVCDGGWKYLSTGAWTDDIDEVAARADEIVYF